MDFRKVSIVAGAVFLATVACGRGGFELIAIDAGSFQDPMPDSDPEASDAGASDAAPANLCSSADGTDIDLDGIPDSCDPCIESAGAGPCSQPRGIPVLGVPSWQERGLHMGVNAARSDLRGYRDRYMEFSDSTDQDVFSTVMASPSTPRRLFYYRQDNGNASRFHANDMMTCIGEASGGRLCDGTQASVWREAYSPIDYGAYFTRASTAADREQVHYMVNSFICGRARTDEATSRNCRADGDSNVRTNLFLEENHTLVGPGMATGPSSSYWEFQLSVEAPTFAFPLVSAGHYYRQDVILFGVNVQSSVPVQEAYVYIDGEQFSLSLELGTLLNGFLARSMPIAAACRSYYFLVVDGEDKLWRYPTQGHFRSGGEGDCVEGYSP